MEINEIQQKINDCDEKIRAIKEERQVLNRELRDAMQAAFEAEHMVKPGDLMETHTRGKVFYDGFIVDANERIFILCHPIKNDGTPSKGVIHLLWESFK